MPANGIVDKDLRPLVRASQPKRVDPRTQVVHELFLFFGNFLRFQIFGDQGRKKHDSVFRLQRLYVGFVLFRVYLYGPQHRQHLFEHGRALLNIVEDNLQVRLGRFRVRVFQPPESASHELHFASPASFPVSVELEAITQHRAQQHERIFTEPWALRFFELSTERASVGIGAIYFIGGHFCSAGLVNPKVAARKGLDRTSHEVRYGEALEAVRTRLIRIVLLENFETTGDQLWLVLVALAALVALPVLGLAVAAANLVIL